MTDIEKKTREYAEQPANAKTWGIHKRALADAFLAGAAYALGNQWRDAEKEKPKCGQTVFIGYFGNNHTDYFDIAYRDEYGTWYSEISEHGYPIDCPTAWLPIPEYKPKEEEI